MQQKKIFGDTWYTSEFNDICDSFDEKVTDMPFIIRLLAKKSAFVHGLILYIFSRGYITVVVTPSNRGLFYFLLLEYFFSANRRVVLFEFIRGEKPNNILRRLIHPLWLNLLIAPIFRKTIRYAHILSRHEKERYSKLYGIPKESFVFIPWPMLLKSDIFPQRLLVNKPYFTMVASGKASCDWETLFAAAMGQKWNLIVICSKRDIESVSKLNFDNQVTVLCDISREEHLRYVREALVYILCLKENYYSAGHVRLSECIRNGVPVIATYVTALESYIIENETGVLVSSSNPLALRNAINDILTNQQKGRVIAKRAFEHNKKYTRELYLQRLKNLLLS